MNEKQIENCKILESKLKQKDFRIVFLKEYTPTNLEELVKHSLIKKQGELFYNEFLVNKTRKIGNGNYKSVQSLGCSRSLQDLYLITISYFPNTTLEELVMIMRKINNDGFMYRRFCPNFKRTMYILENRSSNYNKFKDLERRKHGI